MCNILLLRLEGNRIVLIKPSFIGALANTQYQTSRIIIVGKTLWEFKPET